MNIKLTMAIMTISAALIFYTIGVFWERKSNNLTKNHIVIFWIGLLFDTIGTTIMSSIARATQLPITNDFTNVLHSITGVFAILLMLFHASWATWVIWRNDIEKRKTFHKFSIVVWMVWLIPYFVGMYIGMGE